MWRRFYLEYLKPIAEEERKIEEAEKKAREEQERIAKELAEGKTAMQTNFSLSHNLSVCRYYDKNFILIYI